MLFGIIVNASIQTPDDTTPHKPRKRLIDRRSRPDVHKYAGRENAAAPLGANSTDDFAHNGTHGNPLYLSDNITYLSDTQ
jgi:hypothetical protein